MVLIWTPHFDPGQKAFPNARLSSGLQGMAVLLQPLDLAAPLQADDAGAIVRRVEGRFGQLYVTFNTGPHNRKGIPMHAILVRTTVPMLLVLTLGTLGAGVPLRVPSPPAGTACSPAAHGGAQAGQASLLAGDRILIVRSFGGSARARNPHGRKSRSAQTRKRLHHRRYGPRV